MTFRPSVTLSTIRQAFPYWSGPPADLPADSVNCQYSLDLGDLTGGETGSRNYKMLNKR